MNKLFRNSILTILVLALASIAAVAQTPINFSENYIIGGRVQAAQYSQWRVHSLNAVSAGAGQTFTLDNCYPSIGMNGNGERRIFPFGSYNSVAFYPQVNIADSLGEVVTVTSVSYPVLGGQGVTPYACSFTATTVNAHAAGVTITSADSGVFEAISDIAQYGGIVDITPDAGAGASTGVTNLLAATTGYSNVTVFDQRSGAVTFYGFPAGGTAWSIYQQPQVSANGAQFVPFINEELETLNTGGANTDSTTNLLPANSLVMAVTGRVQTAITGTCSSWTLADTTTAGRFAAANSTLTAGTTSVGTVQDTTGVASATTGFFQSAAAKVRIVCGTGAATTGKIRVTVFGYKIVPAAQ